MGRADAKNKMIKITKQQKEFEKSKRKVVRKKKKNLDENQDDRDMPKLNLSVNSYTDVKKKFEKKKNSKEEPKELLPQKSLRINKLANNPFLECNNVEEKPQKQEVRVNKLQKNAFMMELEKMSSTKEEIKPEQRIKKISSEAHIKFESKKEKNFISLMLQQRNQLRRKYRFM